MTAFTLTSALGVGNDATLAAFQAGRGGLCRRTLRDGGSSWMGPVDDSSVALPDELAPFDCRATRIIERAITQDRFLQRVAEAKDRYGAHRVGCLVGTITGALGSIETRYRENDPKAGDLGADDGRLSVFLQLNSMADYVRRRMDLAGAFATVSNACSSSAKVFCLAQRYIDASLCDAVLVGGIDCLNETFIYGFRSLGLLSTEPCRPWDQRRDGLSLGEAAGFALLERSAVATGDISLLGFGESVDGYHMTAPLPDGAGAALAMRTALSSAGLAPGDIDYVNLHGTGTPANDASEDAAILSVFGRETLCSATKGWTGHTQGAAGVVEAILSMMSIKSGFVPATLNCAERDPKLGSRIALTGARRSVKRVLSNSFGFAGNNCALVFGAAS
ncbi:beta-ketoacyl-ACP synthase [Bradyrhizobium diazoefficiens]|nr:beta-ketoacyl-ACP synthase [Bradyrhizobium diazoefficiens]MBR0770376.1 beta-ketoacyl-ACP synthase [Bradyrhizobium diazoefficiens]